MDLPGRGAAVARGDRARAAWHAAARPGGRRHRARYVSRSRPGGPRSWHDSTTFARWASTSGSSGCGTTTSPSARPDSPPALPGSPARPREGPRVSLARVGGTACLTRTRRSPPPRSPVRSARPFTVGRAHAVHSPSPRPAGSAAAWKVSIARSDGQARSRRRRPRARRPSGPRHNLHGMGGR